MRDFCHAVRNKPDMRRSISPIKYVALGAMLTLSAPAALVSAQDLNANSVDQDVVVTADAGTNCGNQKSPCRGRVDIGGRHFLIHVPELYEKFKNNGKNVSLLLDINGLGSRAKYQRDESGQIGESNRLGFIAIWPASAQEDGSWRGYGCCGAGGDPGDVAFLKRVIAWAKQNYNVNEQRIYATGVSNGGSMVERLGCENPDIRAIAPISSATVRGAVSCKQQVAVMLLRGQKDDTVVYTGGGALDFESAGEAFDRWKAKNGCSGAAESAPANKKGEAIIHKAQNCDNNIRTSLLTLPSSPHVPYKKSPDNDGNPDSNSGVYLARYMWRTLFIQGDPNQ